MYQFKFYCVLLIVIASIVMTSCRPSKIENEAPSINLIKNGQKFRINLKENHTAGENWIIANDINHTKLKHLTSVWHGENKGLDVNFMAIDTGKTVIELKLLKMKDTVSFKRFIVDIRSK
jgi:predicted secreted protein